MTRKDNITMNTFTYFGVAMFKAQCVERGVKTIIVLQQIRNKIPRTRYDELVYEKSQLTFGQLKGELKELKIFSDDELDTFHDKRDYLAHSYWSERAVEINLIDKQPELQKELNDIIDFFEDLDRKLLQKTQEFFKDFELNVDDMMADMMADMIATGKTMPWESFEKLSKNEVILDIFGYYDSENSYMPIFEIAGKEFYTVCEVGLLKYKSKIDDINKKRLPALNDIFPINQFNPRPKNSKLWDYELDLKKNGLKMKVKRDEKTGEVKWGIK